MSHRPSPVRRRGVDLLDTAGADDEVDELRDGEMCGGGAEGCEDEFELIVDVVGVLDSEHSAHDFGVGQREIGRAGGGDFGAAIEGEGDGAQDGEQIYGGGAIEKESCWWERVGEAAALED